MAVLATDNFNRANADPIGGNWSTVTNQGAMKLASNAITPSSLATDSAAFYNAVTWPADQYSQVKVSVNDTVTGQGIGPAVRCAAAAETFYRLIINSDTANNIELDRFVGGAFTQIWNRTATFAQGDLVRLEAQGTTLRAFINGVQVGADATDTNIATGNAGISYSSTGTSASGDDWEGGDFVVASTDFAGPTRRAVRWLP